MRLQTFRLERDEDETGISGTGTVAEGVVWSSGEVHIHWVTGEHQSFVHWPKGLESVEKIHGHGGKTRIVFDEPAEGTTIDSLPQVVRDDPMIDIIEGDLNPEMRDPDGHRYDGQPCECGKTHSYSPDAPDNPNRGPDGHWHEWKVQQNKRQEKCIYCPATRPHELLSPEQKAWLPGQGSETMGPKY
jgi:hypothetical protein